MSDRDALKDPDGHPHDNGGLSAALPPSRYHGAPKPPAKGKGWRDQPRGDVVDQD